MISKKSLIGFGDSLTWGYYSFGEKSHPYSIKLNSLLQQNSLNYEAINYGVNGEKTDEMEERLFDQFEPIFSGKCTNDIGYNISSEMVAKNLKKMSTFLAKYKINHFILTLPANQCDLMHKKYTVKRQEINNLIRESWKEEKYGFLFDLDKEITYLDYSEERRREIWDDAIHFSEKGYDLLGEKIFNKIKSLLI